jgi:hypothetical protein
MTKTNQSGRRVWVKLWCDLLDDYRLQSRSPDAFKFFIELLAICGEYDATTAGKLPDMQSIAWRLRRDESEMMELLDELLDVGLIKKHKNGRYTVAKFKKRQSAMTNAERQKNYRVTKRNGNRYGDVTPSPNGAQQRSRLRLKNKTNSKSTTAPKNRTKYLEALDDKK